MKEQSIIKDLYDHFDELNLGFRPDSREYDRIIRYRSDSLERLREAIPENVDVLLNDYIDMDTDAVLMELKEVYRQGVCFGVKLVSEAFVMNRNRAVTNGEDY